MAEVILKNVKKVYPYQAVSYTHLKRVGTIGKAIGCVVLLIISLFPIYWLVAMSIRPTDEMKGHISLIPQSLTGEHFTQLCLLYTSCGSIAGGCARSGRWSSGKPQKCTAG